MAPINPKDEGPGSIDALMENATGATGAGKAVSAGAPQSGESRPLSYGSVHSF